MACLAAAMARWAERAVPAKVFMAIEELLGVEVAYFTGDTRAEPKRVDELGVAQPALPGDDATPHFVAVVAESTDDADTGDSNPLFLDPHGAPPGLAVSQHASEHRHGPAQRDEERCRDRLDPLPYADGVVDVEIEALRGPIGIDARETDQPVEAGAVRRVHDTTDREFAPREDDRVIRQLDSWFGDEPRGEDVRARRRFGKRPRPVPRNLPCRARPTS